MTELGEELADIASWNVRITGRLVDENALDREILRRRDQIEVLLKRIGSTPERIKAITDPMTLTVANDLRRGVRSAFQATSAAREMADNRREELDQLIMRGRPAEILSALGSAGAADHSVQQAIRRLDTFLSAGRLE